MKSNWETAYDNSDFKITTLEPSLILKRHHKTLLDQKSSVLDVACGAGRNSIFLASICDQVDCFDVADLNWLEKLEPKIKQNISFKKSTIKDYDWPVGKYDLVIASRVIQYLDLSELIEFFEVVKSSMKENGKLLLSYNVNGGIFEKENIQVNKYSHSIEIVKSILSDFFGTILVTKGSNVNTSVNYEGNITSYDIYASHTDKFNSR